MCCILGACTGKPRDFHFISRIANENSRDSVSGEDRVFIIHGDEVLEYNQKNGEITKTDFMLVKPDYAAIVDQKIQEICSFISKDSNDVKRFKTESIDISILNQVVKNNLITVLENAESIDISDINLCDVAKFILKVNDNLSACLASLSDASNNEIFVKTKEFLSNILSCIDELPDCALHDNSEGLDEATILVIGIKMTLSKAKDKLNFEKLLFLLNLVMKKCDKLKSVK